MSIEGWAIVAPSLVVLFGLLYSIVYISKYGLNMQASDKKQQKWILIGRTYAVIFMGILAWTTYVFINDSGLLLFLVLSILIALGIAAFFVRRVRE